MSTSNFIKQSRPTDVYTKCFESGRVAGARRAKRTACLAIAVGIVQMLPSSSALAISGTWSLTTSGGLWSNAANWVSGNIADGSNFTADFSALNLTVDNTVNLNTARTLGNLIFGDTTPSNNWTLANNGVAANTLTLSVASGVPLITVNNQTTTISTALLGTQGLTKAGAGTLLLSGLNTFTGGLSINAGTLTIGASGAVLPTGQNVNVNSGATFNYGNGVSINNGTAAIGALTLNNGTYRVSGGAGDFYVNQLTVGSTGGTIDLTGTNNFWTHLTGTGAGITANTDSTWTGAGTSQFSNDSTALLPISIANGKTVTTSIKFANGTGGFGYRLLSSGTLYLKNSTAASTADFRVENGFLKVDDMAMLGSGSLTLAGAVLSAGNTDTTAVLRYSGATATSAKPIVLDAAGGDINIISSGTTLTLSGVISETGGTGRGLSVVGVGAGTGAVLTGANTYTGPTLVNGSGILSIPTFANGGVASPLGMSSIAAANLRLGGGGFGGDGTLRYTGATASTDRGVTFGSAVATSTLDVATAGTVLTMSGQLVGAGGLTKAGAGTLLLTNNTNTYANNTIINAGTLAIGAGGAVLPAGKNVIVNSGATFDYGNGTTVNNGGQGIGTLTLNSGTFRVSGGAGDFYMNQLAVGFTGGTLDFTGASNFWAHLIGTGAAIAINADSTWTGGGSSQILNDSTAAIPINILGIRTLTSSVAFANGTSTTGFRMIGGSSSTLYLKNPTVANTADIRDESGYLQVDDMAALGTGTITLAGSLVSAGNIDTTATLRYSGVTATSSKALTLDASGGGLYVPTSGTILTLTGVISETGGTGRALSVYGDAFSETAGVALTAANTYTGPTGIFAAGVVSIPTIANGGVASPLGMSSSASANLRIGGVTNGDGTLRYTGATASTDRGATLGSASYKSTIDVTTAGTALTMSGQIVGAGGLTKVGAGTLVLGSTNNTYANGTVVSGGTLAAGANGAALPAGKDVLVNSGATLDYGNGLGISNSGVAIGTLTLNNGTLRVSGGAGDFYLNKLAINTSGSAINLTGTTNFWAHLTGTGAAITVNNNSTWTGAATSRIQNDTAALLPFTINSATVTSSVNFSNGAGFGFRLGGDGNGTLYLSNPTGPNAADFRVENGTLRVDDPTALGSGVITLAGSTVSAGNLDTTATLLFTGASATSAKGLVLDGAGGDIVINTDNTSLTLGGVISESGGTGRALTIAGNSNYYTAIGTIVALAGANTYTGPTAINRSGILSIPTIANGGVASPLGMSTNSPANIQLGGGIFGGDGTLRYTGPTASTDRGVTLVSASTSSTIDVSTAAAALTMSGQITGAGALNKAGVGTLVLTNTTNNYAKGTIVNNGTLAVGVSGAVLPSGKDVTVDNGATLNIGNGGSISNNGAAIGTLDLSGGTLRFSGGTSDFYLNNLFSYGGAVDATGSVSSFTHFTGAGAGITLNGDVTWGGGTNPQIRNDTGTLLPITINNATLTSSALFTNAGAGFRITGDGSGSLYLKNPLGTNSADFRLELGYLQVDDMAALGTGTISLAGTAFGSGSVETAAQLYYTGPSASSSKALTLDDGGGVIYLPNSGTALTLTGVISEAGGTGRALIINGDNLTGATVALTAANTYTGPTVVNFGGILSIPTIANGGVASPLGASSSAPANLRIGGNAFAGSGTLRYIGPTASTDRGVTLGKTNSADTSTIDVATAGTLLTMSGQFVGNNGLIKAGPGTLALTGLAANTYTGTTTVLAGTLSAGLTESALVLTPGGAGLDVQGGKFVFNYTGGTDPIATVKADLVAGYGLASKFSTGQIRDTTLAANRTLGYGDNGSSVTVMLTLPGDANLDGSVNFNDFLVLQNSFNQANTRFDQGNFNYDGVTDFNDFLVLQNNFGQSITGVSVPVTSSEIAAMTAFATANAPVPEPASLAIIGLGIGILGRRRRATKGF